MEFAESPPEPSSVVQLEFRVSDRRYPFVRFSADADCELELLRLLPRGEGRIVAFYAVSGADPDRVRRLAEDTTAVRPRLLASRGTDALFEFEVTGPCPARDLAMLETIPVSVRSERGTGRIEAEVLPPPDPAEVIGQFQSDHPDATLVEKTEKAESAPLFTNRELAQTLEQRLTERQLEVLQTAYDAGYYERPREATGEEIAETLDISVATFSQHVRAAEDHVLAVLFEDDLF